MGEAGRQPPRPAGAAAARRAGGDPRVLRGVRQLPARGGDRVLLLRPARLRAQRSARRAVAVGPRPVRRRGGAGPAGARSGPGELRPARSLLGRDPGHRVRAGSPAAPARAGHLQHDVQRPGVQRLRRAGADAGDGPGGAGRDQGVRGAGRDRGPPVHGAAERAALRPPRAAHAHRGLARPGDARVRAHQPGDLREDAGAERAGHQRRRHAGALGPDRRPGLNRGADAGHRRWPRHHGPGVHGDDGRAAAARALPALPGRQPHGHVRRPAGVLRRPDRLPAWPGVEAFTCSWGLPVG